MEHRRESVDWTGRILSIASLVVAIGIGGYVVTQGEVANTRDELVNNFGQELQGMITVHEEKRNALDKEFKDALDRNDERMNNWNQQLVSAINGFDTDSKRLLEQIATSETRASENRLANFQKEMIELKRLAVSDPSGNASLDDPSVDDTSEDTTETPDGPPMALAAAVLTVADTVLRPGEEGKEGALIRIENDSDEDALIQRIQFKPEADFRVESKDQSVASGTDTVLVFAYDSSDNTSTKPGHHGLYDRELANPIRIPSGENLTLRVVITDGDHRGWGFAGQLRLDYNSKEPLVVKAARVHFDNLDSNEDVIDKST